MIKNKLESAFTIVELIVVISVIGILAGVVLVSYGSWRTSVATASVKSDLQHAASAMESNRSFGNTYSATLPTTFTSSSGDTMTLTVTSATSFCIDGTSSNSSSIQYYIDNLTQATGPKIGTCATRTSALLPSIPTGLTVGLASTTSLSLTWTASSNTTSYTAQCASDTAFIVGSQSTTVTAPTIRAVVTGLSPTTSYYCRVNATNASSTSAWSATVGPTMPAAPSNGGIVTTLAGSGVAGYANGTSSAAQFNSPSSVAVDSSGTVYVADSNNNRIRKITMAGVVTTLAGSGAPGSANGTGTAAQFYSPQGVAVDSSGTVYVADYNNNCIRKITSAGVVTTLAGSGFAGYADGPGTAAMFNGVQGVAVDSSGTVYVADTVNSRIRKITPAGVVTTFAGSGVRGSADGTGTAAQFDYPQGVAVDSSGTVYVADTGTGFDSRIRKITPAGVVTTFAGSGVSGSLDGTGTAAQFVQPSSVAVDSSGTVYVGDITDNRIRKITSAGVVTTLAGSSVAGFADGTGSAALFNIPRGVAVDSSGTVYVADETNNCIRKIQ